MSEIVWRKALLRFLGLTLMLTSGFLAHADLSMRVGVAHEAPIAYAKKNGRFEGFAIDILQKIAKDQGWQLTYEAGTEAEMLDKLEQKQIELLANVPHTEKYKDQYLFGQQYLINNWGEIATRDGSSTHSLLGLDDTRIGIVLGSPYNGSLKELLLEFDIQAELFAYSTFDDVANAIVNNEVDVGVLSRAFMQHKSSHYGIRNLPLVFAPLEVRYVGAGPTQSAALKIIDEFLAEGKKTGSSYYYASLDKWFPTNRNYQVSRSAIWALAVAIALLCGFFLGRGLQRKRTREDSGDQGNQ